MPKLEFKTLREEVSNAIRMRILIGELQPGERIVEQEIAAELGVSRAPVREALREIEQEGLIEYTRNVGCSVKRITNEDIYEIYLLRATYEVLSVKLCGDRFDAAIASMEEALEAMRRNLTEYDFDRSISFDNAFHSGIIDQLGLPRLSRAWKSLDAGNIITYYAGSQDHAAAVERQYPIHKKLYDVYQTKDSRAICKAIMSHYMLTIRRRLSENGAAEGDFNFDVDIQF